MSESFAPEMEVATGHHVYRISRLSVFDQFQVASDFRDIIMGLALLKQSRPKDMDDRAFLRTSQLLITSNAGITPETRARVSNLCLRAVHRKEAMGWQSVLAAADTLQYADIELPDFCQLLYAVFEHNRLLDFFSESPSDSDGKKREAAAGRR